MGAFVAPITGRIDVALSNFAKKFRNNAFIGELVMPRLPVTNQTDKYWIFDRANQELIEQDLRATGDPAQRIRMTLSNTPYSAKSHALSAVLPDEDQANWQVGGSSLQQATTGTLMDKILLAHEKRVIDIISDTAQVTNNTTLSGTSQWSDYTNSNPITAVETGKRTIRLSGVEPNIFIIGEDVYQKLIAHPKIVERFQYVQKGALGTEELRQVFNVRVEVARAVWVNKSGTAAFLMGKDAFLGYASPGASMEDISFGKTFVWSQAPGTVGGIGTVVGRHPEPTAKSDILGVDYYYDLKVTAVETGYLIKAAVA